MPKSTNRAGFNSLSGAKNKKSSCNSAAPLNPTLHQRWLNPFNGEEKFWDGAAWQVLGTVNDYTRLPIKTAVLSETEYAALTPDASTLYFCYAQEVK